MSSVSETQRGRFVVPDIVATHFHIRRGDVVGDFGAGSGYFEPILSQLVGGEGRVYACEIQRVLTEKIGDLARKNNLGNVEALWCDLEGKNGVKLNDNTLDVGVLINTLFQLEDQNAAMQEVARTIRSGGRLLIVDWSESFAGMGPQPDQVLTIEDVKALAESPGFVYERSFDAGDHHYGLAFRKP